MFSYKRLKYYNHHLPKEFCLTREAFYQKKSINLQ